MGKYDSIINMPHHVSGKHPRMSMYQRAAQFAPFAALTGHGAAISETARLTDSQRELSEQERGILDSKLSMLLEHVNEHPVVSITYFVPDPLKNGGKYVTQTGSVRKWDSYGQDLILEGNIRIKTSQIADMECELFEQLRLL